MENCTIYSHELKFDKVIQVVKSNLPKAKIHTQDGGNQKSLIATIKGGFFGKNKTLKINYRERENPSYKLDAVECGLTQNLAGMVNFVQSIPAKNEELRDKFLAKLMSANCEMPFIAEPDINKEFEIVLRKIAQELNVFIFAQPSSLFNTSAGKHFMDKNLDLILDTNGNSGVEDIDVSVDAKYYDQPKDSYKEDQLPRKAKSENFLEAHVIKINKNLPPIPSIEDVELRSIKDIINRAYALLVIAVKGEGIEQEHLVRTVSEKQINSFSPKENDIFNASVLDDQQRAYATWRYESLYTVLWALGFMDELKYPSDICDVQEVVSKIFQPSREDFERSANIRSKSEILDELDKTYRMNWACVDARIKGEVPSGNINGSVIYERHYSLNWLTNHENQEWDDVLTNT